MFVIDYQYKVPTVHCEDHIEIEGINRKDYATTLFMELADKIVLTKPTAVLYAGGASISPSESRDLSSANKRFKISVPYQRSTMAIKELTAYSMHKWIGAMENNHLVTYASINNNTCASSMFSLYEAERLLRDGVVEEVIVIAEERTSFNTVRIFKEHAVPVTPSDGFAIVRLGKEGIIEITDTKWAYQYGRNPFGTTVEGYSKVDSEAPTIKPHGTGTPNNDRAEEEIIKNRKTVYYKKDIGHSQGASALLEVCMLLDDDSVNGDVLCVASGLGGFYGSCILHKNS